MSFQHLLRRVSLLFSAVRYERVFFFRQAGMSSTLARHFGYLFMRDPLAILREHLHPTDDSSTYHFEVSHHAIPLTITFL